MKSRSKEYWEGVEEGIRRYAWWKNGFEQVGTCGTTLHKALRELDKESGFVCPHKRIYEESGANYCGRCGTFIAINKFQIVVYPSESKEDMSPFTAHCLNLDIIADGEDVDGTILLLFELIELHFKTCKEYDANPLSNASAEYYEKFWKAKPLSEELLSYIFPLPKFINKEQLEIRVVEQSRFFRKILFRMKREK